MPVGTSPRESVSADIDKDGNPDLAVMNRDSADVSILIAFPGEVGFGTFDTIYPVDGEVSGLLVFDVNNIEETLTRKRHLSAIAADRAVAFHAETVIDAPHEDLRVETDSLAAFLARTRALEVNGEKIYSKKQTGEFPDPSDIVQAVRAKR